MRVAAAAECRESGGVAADLLLAALEDADPRVRRQAILALASTPEPPARERLLALARSEDRALRRIALEALGREGSADALAILAEALQSGEPWFAVPACRSLGEMGGPEAMRLLRGAVEAQGAASEDGGAALDALAAGRTQQTVAALASFLAAEDPEQRVQAACRLAALGRLEAAPVLLAALEDAERSARAQDALALLLCCDGGDQGAAFAERYRDAPEVAADEWFRRALGLADVPGEDPDQARGVPLDALLKALKDERWYVRQNAVARLEEEFGWSCGRPQRFAGMAEQERLAARWEAYFSVPREARLW